MEANSNGGICQVGHQADPRVPCDDHSAIAQKPGELAGCSAVRVVAALLFAEHAGIVRDERVVRTGFEAGHAIAPTRSEEFVVVARSVAEHRAGDLGDASGLHAVGQRVE